MRANCDEALANSKLLFPSWVLHRKAIISLSSGNFDFNVYYGSDTRALPTEFVAISSQSVDAFSMYAKVTPTGPRIQLRLAVER